MSTQVKCCNVEVYYWSGNFISFDFNDFAVVVNHYYEVNKEEVIFVYFDDADDNYDRFIEHWGRLIGPNTDIVEISGEDFEQMSKAFSAPDRQEAQLYALLTKVFPKHMKLYGG